MDCNPLCGRNVLRGRLHAADCRTEGLESHGGIPFDESGIRVLGAGRGVDPEGAHERQGDFWLRAAFWGGVICADESGEATGYTFFVDFIPLSKL